MEAIMDENNCIIHAEVIIEGVRHKIEDKFVKCDKSLNSRSWDTTKQMQLCEKCFPIKSCFGAQLNIFDQGA